MRTLQLFFAAVAAIGLLAGCSYHKIEREDGNGPDRKVEIEYDD